MPVLHGRNYQIAELQYLWGPLYAAILNVLGSTGTILPFGDPIHGQPDATTFTTVGGEQVTFTWSKAPNTFDEALDLNTSASFQGIIPFVDFDGVDEEADSPDAAYWSRVGAVFSVGAWIKPTDATSSVILSKFDAAGNTREWILQLTSGDDLQLILYDESVSANPTIDSLTDTAISQDVWTHVVATYDGSANASGINLYVDGALAASTDTDDANFVNLEDLGGTVKLAHIDASPASLFDGSIAGGPCGVFFVQKELTLDEIKTIYNLGRRALQV